MTAHKSAEQIADECKRMTGEHNVTKKVLASLLAVAEQALSHKDAGRILVEELGSEEAVRAWIEKRITQTEIILKKWYMGARLHVLEKNATGRKK